MPDSQYPYTDLARECDPVCMWPSSVRYGKQDKPGKWSPAICHDNTCVISDVSIDLVNATVGKINFSELCGGCAQNPDKEGECSGGPCLCSRCIFDNVNISKVNSVIKEGVGVDFMCGSCWRYSKDDPLNPTEIDCKTGEDIKPSPPPPPTPPTPPPPIPPTPPPPPIPPTPPTPPPTPGPDVDPDDSEQNFFQRLWSNHQGAIIAVTVLLILAILVIVFWSIS